MDVITQPESQLLPGLIQRPPELGRIRLGEKSDKGAPKRLTTFRLTSASKATLEAAAQLYGGTVRAWTGAPDEGMWELYTQAAELDVLIPGSLAVISQSYELWQGGTCERRCDGTTEAISAAPCICAAKGLTGGDRECDIVTRLRVMLPRVPGLGVWRLDTSGYQAATTLPSTVTLLARLTPGQWIPAVLRAEQRSKRERLDSGKVETHRFVVPVLDLPGATIGQVVQLAAPETMPLLNGGGERPAPPTAKERAAARRAELEAQQAPIAPAGAGCLVASPRGEPCLVEGTHSEHRNGNKAWQDPVDVLEQAKQAFAGEIKTVGPDLSPRPDADLEAGLGLLGR